MIRIERQRTLERIAALTRNFDDIVASTADASVDDEHDPEGATIAFERQQVGTFLDDARRHVAALDAALSRIAEGAYGICEVCNQPIAPERLEARPTATNCVACIKRGAG